MGIDMLLVWLNGQQKVHNICFIQQHLLTMKMYNWIYIQRYENMIISLYYPAYSYLTPIFNLYSEKSH